MRLLFLNTIPNNGQKPSPCAFTLIELLIVVAIIAILAAIALPNFLEAQTRAKVSRVRNDFRTMALAIEAYAVDHNHYPPDANRPPEYEGLCCLTSPIPYISMDFDDPFNNQRTDGRTKFKYPRESRDCRYEMGTGNEAGPYSPGPASMWAIASYGPDREDDTFDLGPYPFTGSACPYDPTNGSTSNGDLYRLGPNPNHPNFLTDYNPIPYSIAPPIGNPY